MAKGKQRLSMAFLIAALGLFVAFHFLPDVTGREWGWRFWPRVWKDIQNPKHLVSVDAIFSACFLNLSLLIFVSPFLREVFRKSLWAWWSALIISGLIAAACWFVIAMRLWVYFATDSYSPFAGGLNCLTVAPILNFVGLLLARPNGLHGKFRIQRFRR